jgi:hypothetical protein
VAEELDNPSKRRAWLRSRRVGPAGELRMARPLGASSGRSRDHVTSPPPEANCEPPERGPLPSGEFMSRHITVTVSMLAFLALQGAPPSLADDKAKLIGTWKLVSAVSEELATGQKTNIYKGTPIGFITYGADGRVMTIIVDSPRQKPAGAIANAVEAEALFRSMAAYAGSYIIKGNQVIHRPDASWNETWTGTEQIREYQFDGERLMLATAPSPNPFTGRMSVRTLTWEKVK